MSTPLKLKNLIKSEKFSNTVFINGVCPFLKAICVTQIAEVEIYFVFILLRRSYDYVCLFFLGAAYRKSWEKIINFIDFLPEINKSNEGRNSIC